MRGIDYDLALEFLTLLYAGAEHAVEFRVFPNDSDGKAIDRRFSREAQIVLDICARHDGKPVGIYFAVATRLNGSHGGKREDLAELTCLWTDIDTYKIGITKDEAVTALRQCAMPPSIIVDSGGGVHAYWLFKEPLDVRYTPEVGKRDEIKDTVDGTLKQLAGVFAGDTNTCDITRVLRLPATHNTKTGEMRRVVILAQNDNRYELSDIQDMLDIQRPLIDRPAPEPKAATDGVDADTGPPDPYAEFAKRFGFKAPIDVQARLAAMSYMADGEAGIHATQLSVSASLVSQGQASDDEITIALLKATQAAAGHYGLNWNWTREEQGILRMIATARQKWPPPPPRPKTPPPSGGSSDDGPPEQPSPPGGGGSSGPAPGGSGGGSASAEDGSAARVFDFAEQKKARQKQSSAAAVDKDTPLIARLGEAVIDFWQENYGPLIATGTGMATYSATQGIWTLFDDDLKHKLKVTIQGIIAAAKVKPDTSTLNAVYRYVNERPRLHREGVRWDASSFIVCRNVMVNPEDNRTRSFDPELYATWRVDCDFNPEASCPKFYQFLMSALEGGPPDQEAPRVVATLGEHMGASLVKGKNRNLRKALFFLGKSRSGKTRLANIYRALFGGPARCTAIKLTALSDLFGSAPLITAAAWIADDVVHQASRKNIEPINAEQLKNIITGEPMSIRVSGGHYVDTALDIPVVWTGNNIPQIHDDSDAVYNRMLIFRLDREWPEDAPNPDPKGREIDVMLIEDELSGILNFAIFSYARLIKRGRFDPPQHMLQAMDELRENNQPLIRWIQECVVPSPTLQVDNRDLTGSLTGWWLQQFNDDRIPFGKTVASVLKRHYPSIQGGKANGQRYTAGIELNAEGLACLKHAQDTAPMGKTVGSGRDATGVNRPRSKFPE